jgi:transcription termination factor NusB
VVSTLGKKYYLYDRLMKTANDPRHKRRQHLVEELFKIEFHPQKVDPDAQVIIDKLSVIDPIIQKAAPEFPIDKINRIDLAVLRLAVFELVVDKKAPTNVVIDEAVELAKEYGGEASPGFVNGALGTVVHNEQKPSNI